MLEPITAGFFAGLLFGLIQPAPVNKAKAYVRRVREQNEGRETKPGEVCLVRYYPEAKMW
jgi:hypothetical protein